MNLMDFVSPISSSQHANGLLCDIDYSHTNFKSILDDMSIRSWPKFENFILSDISYCKMYVIMNLIPLGSQITR